MDRNTTMEAVGDTLRRIETIERRARAAFVGALVLEGAFFAGFLLLADLRDRTHLLLLLMAASLLTLGALWGVGLVGVVNRHTLRVLRSVELLRQNSTETGR